MAKIVEGFVDGVYYHVGGIAKGVAVPALVGFGAGAAVVAAGHFADVAICKNPYTVAATAVGAFVVTAAVRYMTETPIRSYEKFERQLVADLDAHAGEWVKAQIIMEDANGNACGRLSAVMDVPISLALKQNKLIPPAAKTKAA
jgi:hypothetical protein